MPCSRHYEERRSCGCYNSLANMRVKVCKCTMYALEEATKQNQMQLARRELSSAGQILYIKGKEMLSSVSHFLRFGLFPPTAPFSRCLVVTSDLAERQRFSHGGCCTCPSNAAQWCVAPGAAKLHFPLLQPYWALADTRGSCRTCH